MFPGSGAMSDSGVAPYPQVFVVDAQASRVSVSTAKKVRWSGMGQKMLLILMGLGMLGLVVQASLIYNLYRKVEAFSHCMSHPFCQNQSSTKTPAQQVGPLSLIGSKDHNDVSTVEAPIQKRPFAQLLGSSSPAGENNVVQWEQNGSESSLHQMDYKKGRLVVQIEGHYYLFSKLTLNAAKKCSLIQHKVMKKTKAYGDAIELMKSKSSHCDFNTTKGSTSKPSAGEDLRDSFLAGIFHLQRGDEIFVTLEEIGKIHRGRTDNIMGAFMIAP